MMRSLTRKMKIHKKINTTLLTFLTFTLTLSSYGLDRDYVPRAILSKAQEKEVIALAKKCVEGGLQDLDPQHVPISFSGYTVAGPRKYQGP